MFEGIEFTTPKGLVLKAFHLADAEELYLVVNRHRAYLREWLPWVDTTARSSDTTVFIAHTLEQIAQHSGLQLGIWRDGKIIGVCGFSKIDWFNTSATIGYWLAEDEQGKGSMTEICTSLIEYAFLTLRLKRIEIRCAVDNGKSRAIPERLGFQNEGCLRMAEKLHDRYVDHFVYGLLVHEWGAKNT